MKVKVKTTLAVLLSLLLAALVFLCSNQPEKTKSAPENIEIRTVSEEAQLLDNAYLETLINANGGFSQSDFGGEPKKMIEDGKTSPYAAPEVNPPASHPYMFITEKDIPAVLELMKDPAYKELVDKFWAEVALEGYYDDILDESNATADEDENAAYVTKIFSVLQNKAFASLLKCYQSEQIADKSSAEYTALRTEAELYGYEAIVGLKNALKVFETSPYMINYSHLFVVTAKIYDWCYWLTDADDRNQIIAGVSNKLAGATEFGFPPSDKNGVSGHGTGPQFFRNYVMIAFAFAKEMPDWWEFVGGRYYEEYVTAFNEYSKGGWVTQGTACYGPGKYEDALVSASMIYIATGTKPFEMGGIELAAYYLLSMTQPNGRYFQTGDGTRWAEGGITSPCYLYDILVLVNDPVIAGHFYNMTGNGNYAESPGDSYDMPISKLLAYLVHYPEPDDNYLGKLDTVQYFSDYAASMTARSSWVDKDAAAAYMKIGTRTMSNHDNMDHGTFQIYYKGLLAGSNGTYNDYGSYHHLYYLQTTVSENGILVFNPAYSDDTPVWDCSQNHTHDQLTCKISNASRYFYSGSQKRRIEPAQYYNSNGAVSNSTLPTLEALENWLNEDYSKYTTDDYKTGVVTGCDESSDDFGYLAGDVTSAYDDPTTVKYLERRMLTVFTGDPNYPMLFFTYDIIEAAQASFDKTYLLHTVKEPEIDTTNLTANIKQGDGRLFVQSLYGAQSIAKIGGAGKAYWINGANWENGKNAVDINNKSDHSDTHWGRIELRANGEAETKMLTAMFVTDAANTATPEFVKGETNELYTASFDNIVTGFVKARERQTASFSFTSEGTGIQKYYLTGVAGGLWKISVDGVVAAYINVTEESGVLSFTAPAGEVTVKPLATGSFNDSFENTSADIKEVSTTLGEDIHLNYYVEAPADVDIDTLTMSFTTEDGRVKSDVKGTLADNGNYVFTFSGIGPHQLAMKVRAELFAGDVSRGYKEYSVEQYCRDAIKLYPDNEKLVALINDLIIYGKAAEIYASNIDGAFVYDTGPWSVQASDFIANQSDNKFNIIGNVSSELYVYSAGVVFGTQNKVYFKIYSSAPEAHKITIGSKTYELKNLTKGEDGYYTVSSAAVSSTSLGTEILMTLDDGTNKTDVIYSVNTYLYNISTKGTATVNMKNLAAALYRYGNSCRVYAGIPAGGQFEGKDDVFPKS